MPYNISVTILWDLLWQADTRRSAAYKNVTLNGQTCDPALLSLRDLPVL